MNKPSLICAFGTWTAAIAIGFSSFGLNQRETLAQDVVPAAALEKMTLDPNRLREGWLRLFDGHSLTGWQAAGEANWQVVDGTIQVSEGDASLLVTTSVWENYEFQFEFQCDDETNSGVFLRTPSKPTNPAVDCYELNIAPQTNPFPTGSLVGRQRVTADSETKTSAERWYKVSVKLLNAQCTVSIDDRQVLQYTDPNPLKAGHIGLQHNKGKVAFRNIQLRPLGLETLIPMKDLSQWISDQAGPTKFTVTQEGGLRLEGGKGQLESKQAWGDFVLQIEGVLDHDHSNSGLFFRCIPGEPLNGYECQLHQGVLEGDRSKPADGGLGAIFRRQNARAVLGNPQQPFFVTIVAQGPHLATWSQGVPMVDFTDTRKPDPNPRKGLRTEPGPLMFQGHDPETRLTVLSLRVSKTDAKR